MSYMPCYFCLIIVWFHISISCGLNHENWGRNEITPDVHFVPFSIIRRCSMPSNTESIFCYSPFVKTYRLHWKWMSFAWMSAIPQEFFKVPRYDWNKFLLCLMTADSFSIQKKTFGRVQMVAARGFWSESNIADLNGWKTSIGYT